jgi:hypothetical protein
MNSASSSNWMLVSYMRGYYSLDRLGDRQIKDIAAHCKASHGVRRPSPTESVNKRQMNRLLKDELPESQCELARNKDDVRALLIACEEVLNERVA